MKLVGSNFRQGSYPVYQQPFLLSAWEQEEGFNSSAMGSKLRTRIEGLLLVATHPVRKIEHSTFKRLLFRNRNQHRHGPYFKKLEHVRRVLATSEKHYIWESMTNAIGGLPKAKNGKGTNSRLPLAISTMTLDDLKSAVKLYEELVNVVIPKSAVSITVELISREHFFRFAVAIMATLARLFVIEREILSKLRGLLVEISLWFGEDAKPEKDKMTKQRSGLSEDIGLPVLSISANGSQQKNAAMDKQDVLPKPGLMTSKDCIDDGAKEKDRNNSINAVDIENPTTLYDIIEKRSKGASLEGELKERASVVLSDVLETQETVMTEEDCTQRKRKREAPRKRQRTGQSPEPAEIEDSEEIEDIFDKTGQEAPKKRKILIPQPQPTESSDSEDIDDIFCAMDS